MGVAAEFFKENGSNRPRTHQIHLAFEHVHELWQFVELRALQELAHRGEKCITVSQQTGADFLFSANLQGTEFIDGKNASIFADSQPPV